MMLSRNLSQLFYKTNRSIISYYRPKCSPRAQSSPSQFFRGLSTTPFTNGAFNVQDENDFTERVINSSTPVVVDFHAQWCGPCKLLAPRLESIIGGKGEKVHLAKVDIDEVSDLALEYDVSAVPSVLAIKDGKVVDKFVGLQEESRIEAFVNRLIGE